MAIAIPSCSVSPSLLEAEAVADLQANGLVQALDSDEAVKAYVDSLAELHTFYQEHRGNYPILSPEQQGFEGLHNTQLVDRLFANHEPGQLADARRVLATAGPQGAAVLNRLDRAVIDELASFYDAKESAETARLGFPVHYGVPLQRGPLIDRVFDERSLWGASGKPVLQDVRQTHTADCFLGGALKAIAGKRPEFIQQMVRYDAATQSFAVTLHPQGGAPVTVTVTQGELRENILRGGLSTVDDRYMSTGEAAGAVWPAVIQTAFAKRRDTNHADGLEEGYSRLNQGAEKGFDTLGELTGMETESLTYFVYLGTEMASGVDAALEALYTDIGAQLAVNNPMTYATSDTTQILAASHLYSVHRIDKINGEIWVTLSDPNGEFATPPPGSSWKDGLCIVRLRALYEADGGAAQSGFRASQFNHVAPPPMPTLDFSDLFSVPTNAPPP